jgi:hypothetical protein
MVFGKFYELERQQIQIALNQKGRLIDGIPATLPFDPLETPDLDTTPQVIAPNYLDNSDFDYSKDGYLNAVPAGGDAAQECFNWYRQRFIKVTDAVISGAPSTNISSASGPFKASYTYPMDFVLLNGDSTGAAQVGTLTRVDDNNATLSVAAENNIASGGVLWFGDALAESSANAIKASGHSLFAANEGTLDIIPRWDKTNGWLEAGSDTADRFDIATPLSLNFIRGGITYYFRCIVKKRSGTTDGDPIRLSVGIWDATTAEKRFIESSNMSLTVTPVGTAGSTTYSYVVIADRDDGTSFVSDVITITNGNAALSAANYNRLTWQNATGILRFRIYRDTGGVTKRVFTITNGGQDYNDTGGDEGETLGGLPTASGVRPIAYKVSGAFLPSDGWSSVLISLEIPSTYDTSRTTDKQWLRIGIEGQMGQERQLLIDRVMLSPSNGGWQRSSRDLNRIAQQNPSSLPTETDQGGTGIERQPYCFTLDTPIVVCDEDGTNHRVLELRELDAGMFVPSGGRKTNRIQRVKPINEVWTLVRFKLSNGVEIRCTPSERFITSRADRLGTRIDDLTVGDELLCITNRGRVQQATIEEYEIIKLEEPERVTTISLRPGKTFIAGFNGKAGVIAHNLKIDYGLY